jgi:nucleotide-binding universal stress UspA family protein
MYQLILLAYDGSAPSKKALEAAAAQAKAFNSRLALASVEENVPQYASDLGEVKDEAERLDRSFKELQREAREAAKLLGVDFDRADVLIGNVPKTIIAHARNIGADLIILGASGRSGAWAGMLGTTAMKISHHATCSVLIVR